jgi:hypothetical protein
MPSVSHGGPKPVREKNPTTLEEWRAHFDALEGESLAHKASLANSARFVRTLQEEGYDAEQVHAILIFLAKRVHAAGLEPPDGMYDFARLSQESPPVQKGGPAGRDA